MASQEVPWHALAVLLASASAAVQLLVLPPCALFASMMPQLVPLDCVVPLVCLLDSQVTDLGENNLCRQILNPKGLPLQNLSV